MDPLGSLIDWIATYGMFGLFAIGLAERFIPALPSYGVLVAIGIAAVDGAWSIPVAIIVTTTGSFCGALALYLLVRAVGQNRSIRLLYWISRLLGLSSARIDKTLASFRARERTLIFISQLIPTVRLIAPVVAGLIHADFRRFAGGTLLGITLWNGLFIAAGYFAVLVAPGMTASIMAIKMLVLLIATEALLALTWRVAARYRWRTTPRESRS
ncbi:DedA family protein [Rhizobium leguminosarum]|uniref:DedA family protein n=1 Tax=Rhizobium leguminosarum TaxID=384 RepID=UPI001A92228E|nr:VTT domain-containing protein [Rhizobium leguminosarum]MBY5558465.1 membrane-associated protein [Rhizobium leguminosarum]MBY5725250.1 membrane-associated protein [Rhizobium leguminosarum]QSW27106.1 VTT domain-containing protein [Rhizobium leguminosarum]